VTDANQGRTTKELPTECNVSNFRKPSFLQNGIEVMLR
jgi:hypothetical protein